MEATQPASEATAEQQILGRGAREGAGLLRNWYARLDAAARASEPAAYVFVMGSMAEILRVFDFHLVFPEVNSLQTAIRKVSGEYLNEAEDYGYSADICAYVKADVAVQLRGGKHPNGLIPRPTLAVLTNACNTYIKWAEIWERLYHTPAFVIDVPGPRHSGWTNQPGSEDFERDRCYVEAQLRELIVLCERVTGRRFDIDRLREVLAEANATGRVWREMVDLNRSRPAPFNAVGDGTVYLGVMNALRATPEGTRYFERVVEELRYKVEHGLGSMPKEEFRLCFVGVPCYPIFRRFNELFTEHNGNFVTSTYMMFASGGQNVNFEYDLTRPLESLAEGVLLTVRTAMFGMFFTDQLLAEMIEPFQLDGVVYHAVKSCRTVSTGLADTRRSVMARYDIPSLHIESDLVDKRVVAEAPMKNRTDAFFEALAGRRLRAA